MLSLFEVTLICEKRQKYAHFESLICEKKFGTWRLWHCYRLFATILFPLYLCVSYHIVKATFLCLLLLLHIRMLFVGYKTS